MSAIITYPDTDPQFNDSKNISLQKILQVLNNGSSGGGGGGSSTNYNLDGVVDPTANPSDTTKTWTYTNTVTAHFWVWKANGVAWLQIV